MNAPTTRVPAARRCKLGYEFGYYEVSVDDSRVFVRVGVARTYERAAGWLEIVMSEKTVSNTVKDRSKYMRLKKGCNPADPVYEYGWMVINRRNAALSEFTKHGEGSYEEAQLWMTNFAYRRRRPSQAFVFGGT